MSGSIATLEDLKGDRSTPETFFASPAISDEEENKPKPKFSFRVFRYCTRLDHFLIGTSMILNFGSGILMPLFMSLMGDIISVTGGGGGGRRSLQWYVSAQLILGAINFVLAGLGAACMEMAAERQKRAIRSTFLQAVTRQEMGWFDRFDGGVLSSRLNESIKVIRSGIGLKLAQIFLFMGMFLGGYAVGLYKGWKLALVVTATLPALAFCGAAMMMFMGQAGTGARKAYAAAGSTAEEAFSTIRSIAAFGLEGKMVDEYKKGLDESFRYGQRESVLSGVGQGLMQVVFFCTFALAFWYGSKLVADDIDEYSFESCLADSNVQCYDGGTVLSVFFSVVFGAYAVGQAGPHLSALTKASGAVDEIEAITKRISQIDSQADQGRKAAVDGGQRIKGEIELRNIKFAYPTRADKPVFNNLNLTIPAGKSVALVGGSGCGKSTIIQLVERFYDPDAGEVLFDGEDLRNYNPNWIRGQMALVSQEPRLFATTIRENIRLGTTGCGEVATDDEIVLAAKNANAHDFIADFPDGYDTYAGEGGGQLSGGQKQRIAIARAVVRNPSVLILDEATSALDNESEKIVQTTLDRIVEEQKRTTIIIAHRLTTVRKADLIVVLDNPDGTGSRVVEKGTHEELMAIPNGLYYNLVKNQQEPTVKVVDDAQFAEVASHFESDIPKRELSGLKLRQRFSRFSRHTFQGSMSRMSGLGSIMSKHDDAESKMRPRHEGPRVKWRQVVQLLIPWWMHVGLGLLAAMVNGCAWPVFAICMSEFLTSFFQEDAQEIRDDARFWSLIFLVFAGGVGVAVFLQHFLFGYAGTWLTRELREHTFTNIMYQDMEFFDNPENATGNLSQVLSADVVSIRGWVGENLGIYLQNISALVAGLIIAFTASVKLAAVCVAGALVLAPAMIMQAKFFADDGNDEEKTGTEALETTGFVINETIMNIRTVAAYSLEAHACDRYDAMVEREYRKGKTKAYVAGLAWGFVQFGQFAVQALFFWYGGRLVTKGEIEPQTMLRGIFSLMWAVMGMGESVIFAVDGAAAQGAANRVWAIKDRKPKIDARSIEGRTISGLEQELKFENVNFRYPQRPDVPIYQDLSFSLRRGEVVALVGPSGCGKSTAVQLIERFYDVSDDWALDLFRENAASEGVRAAGSGKITVDGLDIRDINVRSLRGRIGLVNQEPVLFSQSVAENIAVGKEGGATLEEVVGACKMANAHTFIDDFPEGYDTNVGKLGGRLSGGQKQRIAIARALIRNPDLLILDEATSALDSESEKIVQAALDELLEKHKRSTIVIAHRLSTVRNADKIVVLVNEDHQGSRVVEVGTHEQLMAIQGGVYRGLVEIAAGGQK